jgi:hypothetical protein
MNTIFFIIWLQPIIFMIHDFEEIVMAEVWGKRFKAEIDSAWPKKQPFGINYIKQCQTPTFAIGVEVEFLIFTVICLLSAAFQNYVVWMGAFLSITLHMVIVHLPLCLKIRKYVPGIITSAVFFFPSVWLLYQSFIILHYGVVELLLALLVGIALIVFVMPLLHKAMGSWSEWLYKYSKRNP